jgi:hypothetical protein
MRRTGLIAALWFGLSVGAVRAAPAAFGPPRAVAIEGYDGQAMEPFVSRDGRWLFFNNPNDPAINTDLFWAERTGDCSFRFKGPLAGANSPDLDAVASKDRFGTYYFVTSRDYAFTGALIHRGRFAAGRVTDIAPVKGLVSPARPGFNFDAEISADGRTLYYVESRRGAQAARLAIADARGDGFARDPRSDALLARVNGPGTVYAPATTADGLTLFFTWAQAALSGGLVPPQIYEATRADPDAPFSAPARIDGLGDFVEAPTVSPDGRTLYYHARIAGRFRLFCVTRRG